MRKLKVYLDTSVVSYLYQEDAPEKCRTPCHYGSFSGRSVTMYACRILYLMRLADAA